MAVWFRVTVRDVGDTITTGADMDLPASPLGPGCPGAPVLPTISYMLSIKTNVLEKFACQNTVTGPISSSTNCQVLQIVP